MNPCILSEHATGYGRFAVDIDERLRAGLRIPGAMVSSPGRTS